jgi:MFS transporter, DHA2 family, multidrug resistance protein
MGFSDTFAVIGIVLVLAGISLLLTGRPKGTAAGAAH